jgi:hypothetical protein
VIDVDGYGFFADTASLCCWTIVVVAFATSFRAPSLQTIKLKIKNF